MQPYGITPAFYRETANSSRELVGPDITAAATLERYPRFIKGGFQDYERLGVKDPLPVQACSLPTVEVARNNVFGVSPTKESNFWN